MAAPAKVWRLADTTNTIFLDDVQYESEDDAKDAATKLITEGNSKSVHILEYVGLVDIATESIDTV